MSVGDILPEHNHIANGNKSLKPRHTSIVVEQTQSMHNKDSTKMATMVTELPTSEEPKERLRDLLPSRIPPSLSSYRVTPPDYVARSNGRVQHVVAAVVVMHRGKFPVYNQNYDVKSIHEVVDKLSPRNSTLRTLLVKRDRHDYMGSMWEVSGGSADDPNDASILEAAARELREETGLRISKMIDVVEDDHEWPWKDTKTGVIETWRKFTFLAEAVTTAKTHTSSHIQVASNGITNTRPGFLGTDGRLDRHFNDSLTFKYPGFPTVTLKKGEHEDCVWATEEEVRRGFCQGKILKWTTPEQKAAVLRAFDIMRRVKTEK